MNSNEQKTDTELQDKQLEDVAGGGLFENTKDEFSICPRCGSKNTKLEYDRYPLGIKSYYSVCKDCGFSGRGKKLR
jgi:Zn finger protein HypA/HybF involved in hydrogenase expression